MVQRIRVKFTDFWDWGSDIEAFPLYRYLSQRFDLEISESPDFVIYSCFGSDYKRYRCPRIFYTGESVRPDFKLCDFAFTFDHLDDSRHTRFPLYRLGDEFPLLTQPIDVDALIAKDRRFCSFVYSNPKAKERQDFFHKLSAYKQVDSGGKVLNNLGHCVENKHDFLSQYKFAIAFENESYPGYTTEKISEAFAAHTVPIYWGNPLVAKDFNPDAFIHCNNFSNFDEVVEYVRQVDEDDELYRKYLSAPAFKDNKVNEYVDDAKILDAFERIFSDKNIVPVAKNFSNTLSYLATMLKKKKG